jgi:hypothetical protein
MQPEYAWEHAHTCWSRRPAELQVSWVKVVGTAWVGSAWKDELPWLSAVVPAPEAAAAWPVVDSRSAMRCVAACRAGHGPRLGALPKGSVTRIVVG